MEAIRRLEPLWLLLVVIGGINWALVALFDWNMVAEIFGTGTATDVVYVLVGFAALMFLPRLFDDMHLTGDRTHPRGA